MLHYVVFAAEAATVIAIGVFCMLLASDGLFGRIFAIHSHDPVVRWFIRNVQVAFVLGYSVFFASTIYILIGQLA